MGEIDLNSPPAPATLWLGLLHADDVHGAIANQPAVALLLDMSVTNLDKINHDYWRAKSCHATAKMTGCRRRKRRGTVHSDIRFNSTFLKFLKKLSHPLSASVKTTLT